MNGPILLTGAGGDIGQSVARCMRDAFPQATLLGADCQTDTPLEAFFDEAYRVPRADSLDWLPELERLVEAKSVAMLLPLAEAELAALHAMGRIAGNIGNAKIISANPLAVATGLDKLATNRALAYAGIAVPETGIVGDDEPGDFDVVIKPRSSQGSKALEWVKAADFRNVCERRGGDLWQRALHDEDAEYTCGIVHFPSCGTRVMSFRRKLSGGLTSQGVHVASSLLRTLGEHVAEALNLRGAINMQLRMDRGVPLIFEVNPRLSSTVGFRHSLGFQDAVWSILDAQGEEIPPYEEPTPGSRIFRVAQELILAPESR